MAADRDGSEPVGGHVRLFARGGVWQANFQHAGRQRRVSLRTRSKKEARLRAARLDAELAAGTWGRPPPAVPVAEAVAAYLDHLGADGRAPRTLAKYRHVLGRVAALAAARRAATLADVDRRFADAYLRARADAGAAPKTRYTEAVIVRQLVNFALSRDLLAADPLKGWRVKKPKPTPQPCWTRAEVVRILAAAPPAVRPALTVLAEAGLRVGELGWLTWADIDLTGGWLHVRPKDGWRPKSGDARAVPLRPGLAALLGDLPRAGRWVAPMPGSAGHPAADRPWTERRLLAALKRVLAAVGLAGRLHAFRHSFVSHALLAGVPPAVVRHWVGHLSDEVLRLYTHVPDAASQDAMRRMGGGGGRVDN